MRGSCAQRVHNITPSVISVLTAHGITLTTLKPLGAAVRGVNLRTKPPEEVLEALQSAMATRGFLVFKEQGVLSGDEQVKASEYWGAREMHSTHGVHPKAPNEHIFRLSNDRAVGILGVGPQWHNDGSFERGVFSHVGYHIVRVAENGGGTIFAHQGGAFDALPEAEQERWQRLVSVNSNSGVLHPVVHEHPISGRKSVYLHLGMTGAVLEVTPPANDPKGIEKLRLLEQDEMRHLFQSYNALLNKGFATGAADLLGGAPRYGALVELQNLNSKPELNGQQGVVVGVLDRTNGRVAVELMEGQDPANPVKRPRMAVKPENLKVLRADAEAADAEAADGGVGADDEAAPASDVAAVGGEAVAGEAEEAGAEEAGAEEAGAEEAEAYTAVYEYEEGDCIFIDNLAVAHRASPEAHKPSTEVGLRILHRTTIRAPQNFDPPYGLPPVLNVLGPNPLGGGGVWQGGGLGFRWDETIPMQN